MKARLSLGCLVASVTASVGFLGAPFAHSADPLPQLQLRQTIIRVPESALFKALEKKPDDDTLATELRDWASTGAAQVVSDLSAKVEWGGSFDVKNGLVYKWVVENDQDSDKPVLTPTSWQDVFLGTSLRGEYRLEQNRLPAHAEVAQPAEAPLDPFSPVRVRLADIPGGLETQAFGWATETRAQMNQKVRWPLVWPENRKPEVGWYEQDDFLTQTLITDARIRPGHTAVLAFLRPASDLESEPTVRELDVVLAHAASQKTPASKAPSTTHPAVPRVHLLGFGLNDRDATEFLTHRQPGDDAALLGKLQALVQEGKAARRLVCGAQASSFRGTLATVREHSYPTEMPTIPSAWNMCPVGTRVEMELMGRSLNLVLTHHPARFRWAEWKCALDAPELIMNQPQFFVQRVQTNVEIPEGNVALVAAMRTPECLKGSDKGPVMGETMLIFAELNQPAGTPPLKRYPSEEHQRFLDLEAVIFELPVSEIAEWQGHGSLPVDAADDEQRFQKALAKVKEGKASVVCHLAMAAQAGQRSRVEYVEEFRYVTEYNPVDHNPTGRYRPTAIEERPVGSIWEVDASPVDPNGAGGKPMFSLNSSLRHDALPAVQPTLKEAMKYTQDHTHDLPVPVFTTDEWVAGFPLVSGKALCLGPVRPKGARFQDRIHVAFVRGVVRK
ncbi:hypothetical protein DES53_109149 [Roseimicrobium gellanilyticum]|uniref:Uncharacterized protein n=1 Tax=Roseimicrobium gellanilyticum TaxID=748857 RepID=A0A366HBH9_9BACT|nr:hypothetical protein [Roseimicrobium gellanilyticum]RBP39722.1 hypothetical protein DES53_109149 [Roseimicrobium gellanilyticum]